MRRLALAILGAVALAGCGGGGEGGGASGPAKPDRGRSHAPASPAIQPAARQPGAHKAPHEAVPILMYHVINAPLAGTAQAQLWVPRSDFAAQMQWLADHGFHAVTLQQVWVAWHHGGLLPSKPIVLSFDDGYHSHLTNAMPILREHRWPGVLNLQINQTRLDLKPNEVRQLIAAGWEVDAHTYTHPDLTTVDSFRLTHEIADARTELRRTYGVPVNFFCYPAGRYDNKVIVAVSSAGYLGATTTEPGRATPGQPPYALKRIRVNGSDGVKGLAASLGAGASA
jgi:peptidoglycan/xylan/chitin deacetylase (PgdA/CDA1 family)